MVLVKAAAIASSWHHQQVHVLGRAREEPGLLFLPLTPTQQPQTGNPSPSPFLFWTFTAERLRRPISAAEPRMSHRCCESRVLGSDELGLAATCPHPAHTGRIWARGGQCPRNVKKNLGLEEEQGLNMNNC